MHDKPDPREFPCAKCLRVPVRTLADGRVLAYYCPHNNVSAIWLARTEEWLTSPGMSATDFDVAVALARRKARARLN